MGFNTTVLILNDAWRDIEENPAEFVEKLRRYVNGGLLRDRHQSPIREIGRGAEAFGVGRHSNAASVMTGFGTGKRSDWERNWGFRYSARPRPAVKDGADVRMLTSN